MDNRMPNPQQESSTNGMRTVADAILEQLVVYGVRHIYGVVGDTIFPLMDAIAKQTSIRFIAVKHECTAAFMASADAKLTGGLGVCIATAGPGLANLLNGLGDANSDQVPVLAITGQVETYKVGTDTKQYVDQQQFTAAVTGSSTLFAAADATIEVMEKAARHAQTKGCVSHISVPKDVFSQFTATPVRQLPVMLYGTKTFASVELEKVHDFLLSARSPIILAGLGARGYGEIIEEFAGVWGAGIICNLGAKGVIQDACPWMLGGLGEGGSPYAADLLKSADIVLMIGNTWWPERYVPKQGVRIVQIDLEAQQIGAGFQVEIGILGDVKEILPLFLDILGGKSLERTQWRQAVKDAREKWLDTIDNEQQGASVPLHPAAVMGMLARSIPEQAIITLDTGDHTIWFNRVFRARKQTILFSGTWRTLGFGLPAAMAAKLKQPEQLVVAIVGDGGFEMCLADLLTATRYQLPIVVILMDNGSLAMEKNKLRLQGQAEIGTGLTNPDFVALAHSCGWESSHVQTLVDLEKAMGNALTSTKPYLLDVHVADVMIPNLILQ